MSLSASKSSANTSTTTNNTDRRVAADNGAIVLGDGSTYQSMDAEVAKLAISSAVDTERVNADLLNSVHTGNLQFASHVTDTAADLVTKQLQSNATTLSDNNQLAETLTKLAVASANPNATSNDALKQVATVAAVGAVAIAGFALLKK